MQIGAILLCSILAANAAHENAASQVNTHGKHDVTLAGLRDRSRPLLIFAAKPDDPQLQIQLRTLEENAAGVAERDITIIALPYHAPSPSSQTMSEGEAEAARRRFKVAPLDFTVILLGKDGGEKLRSTKPVSYEKLRDTVDAMPMRRDEMRRRQAR